ncbi:MAG: hypothetical protein ACOVO1_09455 [Chitinophagaceae bacterium]
MKVLKSGKEEIVYLLSKVIEKYKSETGQEIVQNTNRKNYEVLAILLSDISNKLPQTWEELGTEQYADDENKSAQTYPYRKYDITGGQIKDALNGIVAHPRSFLVDACYIYLYGIGRKKYEQNPTDENLLYNHQNNSSNQEFSATVQNTNTEADVATIEKLYKKRMSVARIAIFTLFIIVIALCYTNFATSNHWKTVKNDLNLLPYQPTKAEIDSLEGVWLCYTGSPQARISDPARYHKVVPNLINIEYKNGYFIYNRYGASFNHIGYMQFESPGIVSVYSRIKNNSNLTESPRHSLLNLYTSSKYLAAISASWNFDVGERNKIIGIREIYIKLGKGGTVTEVINEVENASCNCKLIKWQQPNSKIRKIYLKNELLDSVHNDYLKQLIDEKSILENIPQDNLIIFKDSIVYHSLRNN